MKIFLVTFEDVDIAGDLRTMISHGIREDTMENVVMVWDYLPPGTPFDDSVNMFYIEEEDNEI
jgi:hypothetical protein